MRTGAALPLVLGLVGCGPQMVEGSLGSVTELRYSRAALSADSSQVKLQFILVRSDQYSLVEKDCPLEDTVFELTTEIGRLTLKDGTPVDLTQPAPTGGQRGRASTNLCSKPAALPELELGQLTLSQVPTSQAPWVSGQKVTGSFSVTFVEGTSPYDGRTAYKTFEAHVQ